MKKWIKIIALIGGLALVWLTLATPSSDIYGSVYYHGPEKETVPTLKLALTFDDGPYGEPTQKILDILKEKNVKATFFLVGANAQKYPDLVKREIAEGHIVGNHSQDHAQNLASEPVAKFKTNVLEAEKNIFDASGLHPRFYRPPFGLTSSAVLKTLSDLGYQVIMWDNMTNDWDAKQPGKDIAARIIKRLKPDGIIGLHDGRDTHLNYPREDTIEALPIIIDQARAAGYEFVPLDELLNEKPYFEKAN